MRIKREEFDRKFRSVDRWTRERGADRFNAALVYAKHTLAIEGRELSAEAEDLIRRQLSGEIPEQEFLKQAKELGK